MNQNEKDPEDKLITRAKKGDMEAFESLVRKYQQSIYYLCHRMTGAHQAADDLSQETFIKAYFSLPRFKDGMNFYTWIRKIALNNSLNYLKAHKREEPLDERESRIPGNSSLTGQELPQDRVQRNHLEQKFKKALKALPADQKVIFCLRFYEDLSYKEISQLLNLPNGTVMSRLNRTRKKLRALMSDHL
ncbi:MAG: sigma-70 family RNA polymerase sigma factor [Candidatus Aminicenantes bacterium]|nr:MAG: sigma-70 family RNA polymerase sigma factor [Candidatus Aminicenantes bacterium]